MEFEVEARFNISAERLYKAYLNSEDHSGMTGGEAQITDEENEAFTAWDGYIWGTNLILKPFNYIKQHWRTSDFKEFQEFSIVEIFLESDGEKTIMRIRHSELEDEDMHYKQGWVDNYFTPMKAYFND